MEDLDIKNDNIVKMIKNVTTKMCIILVLIINYNYEEENVEDDDDDGCVNDADNVASNAAYGDNDNCDVWWR